MRTTRRHFVITGTVLAAAMTISCVFSPMAWSPDSRELLFVTASTTRGHFNDPHELQACDVASGKTRLLLKTAGFFGPPAFSADGKLVALLDTDLFRRSKKSPETKPATAPATREADNGKRRLYLRLLDMRQKSSRRIQIGEFPPQIDPDEAADSLLLTAPAFGVDPTTVFCQVPAQVNEDEEARWDVCAVDTRTGKVRRIASGVRFAVFSTDRKRLAAFATTPPSTTQPASATATMPDGKPRWDQLVIATTDGKSLQRLDVFKQPGEPSLIAWLADGKSLVVWGKTAKIAAQQLLLVQIGQKTRRIPWSGDRPAAPPVALSDGRLLVLQRTDISPIRTETGPASRRASFRIDLLAISLPEGRAGVLNTGDPLVQRGFLSVSPDGKWIAIRESLEGKRRTDLQRSRIRLLDAEGKWVRTIEIKTLASNGE